MAGEYDGLTNAQAELAALLDEERTLEEAREAERLAAWRAEAERVALEGLGFEVD